MLRRGFLKFFGAGAAAAAVGMPIGAPPALSEVFGGKTETASSLLAYAEAHPSETWRLEEKLCEDPVTRMLLGRLSSRRSSGSYLKGSASEYIDADIASYRVPMATKFRMQAERRIKIERRYLEDLKKLVGL